MQSDFVLAETTVTLAFYIKILKGTSFLFSAMWSLIYYVFSFQCSVDFTPLSWGTLRCVESCRLHFDESQVKHFAHRLV